jgi:tetratricopeptide (TPR) repeat protein
VSVLEFIERFQAEPRMRQRVGALTGVSVFFAAGFIVAGFGQVVLAAIGLAVAGGVFVLMPWSVSRNDLRRTLHAARSGQAWHRLSTLVAGAGTSAKSRGMLGLRRTWVTRGQRAQRMSETRSVAEAIPPPTADELYGWPYVGSAEIALTPSRPEPRFDEQRRRAVELNTHGIDLRRAGSPAAAAALHLEALQILQSLHDEGAQAPTLNSLALALAANGETDAAVERFEQSLSILRERPGDPGEGEVIANLGFTLLRQGDDEHARELLSEALEKLPPDSRAAQKVEAQLRRAS